MRLDLLRESSDITQTIESKCPVIHFSIRDKAHRVTCQQHPAKILTVIVAEHANVPRTSGQSELSTYQPDPRLHVDVPFHLAQQPLTRSQITPESGRLELRLRRSVHEASPSG